MTGADELEIISALVGEDSHPLWEFADRLNEYHFEYEPAKILFKLIRATWNKTQDTPSRFLLEKQLKIYLPKIGPDLYSLCKDGLELIFGPRKKATENFLAEFIAGREVRTLSKEVDNLEFGNYRDYVKNLTDRLDRINSLGGVKAQDRGLNPFSHKFLKNWNTKIKESFNGVPIGTGFTRIDDFIEPLYPGELGLFIAPTGKGKSVWLTNLAWHASFNLKIRVVYFALDNLAAQFALRFLTRATGIYIRGAKRKYPEDVVERQVAKKFYQVTGGEELRLHVQSFPRNSVSTRAIKNYIQSMRREWVREDKALGITEEKRGKVDLILMDYVDLMILDNPSGQDWIDREKLYNNLSALGSEERCPVWTVSQTNTLGMMEKKSGKVKEYHAAGGTSKLSPVRVGFSLQQTPEEKLKGIFNLLCWKATDSESDIIFPMRVNYQKQIITERMDLEPYAYAGGTILSTPSQQYREEDAPEPDFKDEKPVNDDIFSNVQQHFKSE